MRIFIACPAGIATGGTELLHQLGCHLNKMGIENYMVYVEADGVIYPMPEVYTKYGVSYVSHYVDATDSVLILPEGLVHLNKWCKKGKVAIWWLSVDNFCGMNLLRTENLDIFGLSERKDLIHLVQSRYAEEFLRKCFGINKIMYLSDYINDDIVAFAMENAAKTERKNVCLYNPKKGYENMKAVIQKCRKDIQWVPLKGFSPVEMAAMMCISKVYIDFGSHPGKDRIPREAAICGCNIITNKKGSAANSQDVDIVEKYKIEDMKDTDAVLECIYDLVDNYEIHNIDYESYRNKILNEKDTFISELQTVVDFFAQEVENNDPADIEKSNVCEDSGILDSVDEMLDYVKQMVTETKECKRRGQRQDVVSNLLMTDNYMQMMKEALYTEIEH